MTKWKTLPMEVWRHPLSIPQQVCLARAENPYDKKDLISTSTSMFDILVEDIINFINSEDSYKEYYINLVKCINGTGPESYRYNTHYLLDTLKEQHYNANTSLEERNQVMWQEVEYYLRFNYLDAEDALCYLKKVVSLKEKRRRVL